MRRAWSRLASAGGCVAGTCGSRRFRPNQSRADLKWTAISTWPLATVLFPRTTTLVDAYRRPLWQRHLSTAHHPAERAPPTCTHFAQNSQLNLSIFKNHFLLQIRWSMWVRRSKRWRKVRQHYPQWRPSFDVSRVFTIRAKVSVVSAMHRERSNPTKGNASPQMFVCCWMRLHASS